MLHSSKIHCKEKTEHLKLTEGDNQMVVPDMTLVYSTLHDVIGDARDCIPGGSVAQLNLSFRYINFKTDPRTIASKLWETKTSLKS